MNAGKKSADMGQKGISNSVEDVITARDILLAKETGAQTSSVPLLYRRQCENGTGSQR